MSLTTVIQNIFASVNSGNSLTRDEYELLAQSSENQTVKAVGQQAAQRIEVAYNSYVQAVIIPEVESFVLHSDGEGNEWYESK